MKFAISPLEIFDESADIPALTGPNDTTPLVPGAPGTSPAPPGGEFLENGVSRKWDSSRRFRFAVVNPALIPRVKFSRDLRSAIISNPPNGTQIALPAALIGNDDPQVDDESSDPYSTSSVPDLAHARGEVTSFDRVTLSMPDAGGAEGNTIELNFYAEEFVRLQLPNGWYLVSDSLPFQLNLKARFTSGQFIDNGSTFNTNPLP